MLRQKLKLGFYNSKYIKCGDRTGIVREARMPGSLQPQSAREWQPDDVAPLGRGHEHPSLSLVVSSRCRAARAAGAASESPVSDSAPPAVDGDACRGERASGLVRCRSGDEVVVWRARELRTGRPAQAQQCPARAGPTGTPVPNLSGCGPADSN